MKTAKEACQEILQNRINMFTKAVVEGCGTTTYNDYMSCYRKNRLELSMAIDLFIEDSRIKTALEAGGYKISLTEEQREIVLSSGFFGFNRKVKTFTFRKLTISACCGE